MLVNKWHNKVVMKIERIFYSQRAFDIVQCGIHHSKEQKSGTEPNEYDCVLQQKCIKFLRSNCYSANRYIRSLLSMRTASECVCWRVKFRSVVQSKSIKPMIYLPSFDLFSAIFDAMRLRTQSNVINGPKFPLSIYLICGSRLLEPFGNYKSTFCRWHNVSASLRLAIASTFVRLEQDKGVQCAWRG